jgi:hypothetical protein
MLKLLKQKGVQKSALKTLFLARFTPAATGATGNLFSTTFSTGFQAAKIQGG